MDRKKLYGMIGVTAAGVSAALLYRYRDRLPEFNTDSLSNARESVGRFKTTIKRIRRISHELSELSDGWNSGRRFFERAESALRLAQRAIETIESSDDSGSAPRGDSGHSGQEDSNTSG